MRTHLWIFCCLAVVGVAEPTYQAPQAMAATPAEGNGPQISNGVTVDWTALKSIISISLTQVHFFESGEKHSPETIKLEFFPRQKFITLETIPVYHASLHCTERGESYELKLIASPGGGVSDHVTCDGQNFTSYRLEMNYTTRSQFAAGNLTIDGSAQVHRDSFDNNGKAMGRDDYDVELHGSLQISGTNCRVNTWRQVIHRTGGDFDDRVSQEEYLLQSAADTRCSIVLGKQ